jgi:hypothetical protein
LKAHLYGQKTRLHISNRMGLITKPQVLVCNKGEAKIMILLPIVLMLIIGKKVPHAQISKKTVSKVDRDLKNIKAWHCH